MKATLLITPFADLAGSDDLADRHIRAGGVDSGGSGYGSFSELLVAIGNAARAAFGFAIAHRTATGELQPVVSTLASQPAEPIPEILSEPLPAGAFDSRRSQYAAVEMLAYLARRAESGLTILGITGVDLFAPRLSFVFGIADRAAGTAIISLHRLTPEFYGEPPDPALSRERAVKEAIHELGHVLGLDHCKSAGCIMRFSSMITDTDEKGPGFCGRCSARLGPITRPD